MLELHAVRDLGQGIDTRQVADAFLRASPLGDVLRCIDPVAPFTVTLHYRAGIRHGNRLAVLAFENRFARQAGRSVVGQRTALLLVDDEID